jgi:hypothetical protein
MDKYKKQFDIEKGKKNPVVLPGRGWGGETQKTQEPINREREREIEREKKQSQRDKTIRFD